MSLYWQLFLSFVQIGLFSFGGGYAALMLIQQQVVHLHGWLSMSTFADLITIAEMTPGPIAINAATFVGLQVAGFPGAIFATFSLILPPCIILTLLAYLYKRYHTLTLMQGILNGLRPAIVAMIASAGVGIITTAFWPGGIDSNWLQTIDWPAVGLFAICFFALRKWKLNPILIILACGGIGIVLYLLGLA